MDEKPLIFLFNSGSQLACGWPLSLIYTAKLDFGRSYNCKKGEKKSREEISANNFATCHDAKSLSVTCPSRYQELSSFVGTFPCVENGHPPYFVNKFGKALTSPDTQYSCFLFCFLNKQDFNGLK